MACFKIASYALSCLLLLNTFRVIHRLTSEKEPSPLPCCDCYDMRKPSVTPVASKLKLDASLTLSRLGSDLPFNTSSCPAGSIMTSSIVNTRAPRHDNCPTLFIIGGRKCGTTSLYQYISRHPDFTGIFLDAGARAGETFYFSKKYEEMTWSDYIGLFPNHSLTMTGESSVDNLVQCEAPRRLFESCGRQPKIVVLLRDPINRFESNFFMKVDFLVPAFDEGTALGVVVMQTVEKLARKMKIKKFDVHDVQKSWPKLTCVFEAAGNMAYEGLYYVHLQNWLCNFPSENILIINTEEFSQHPCKIVQQTLAFLGLSPLEGKLCKAVTSVVYNKRRARTLLPHQVMSPEERRKLTDLYSPFNEKLIELLNWTSVDWGFAKT